MRKIKKRFGKHGRVFRDTRINNEITEEKVRLITDDGAKLISIEEALKMSRESGEDLVEITKSKDWPIVKIIDYGKYKFEKAKKDKESKKKQKVIQIKEIKMGPKIDVGDFERKCLMAKNFLLEGDNVKVSMRFRGREMAHTDLGLEKLQNFAKNIEEDAVVEKPPSLEGRIMSMILRPKGKKSQDKPKQVESIPE
ncbi:MAG: translation initiation factor IF-3 [Spirochaetia bacterium]|nr:translation initiation factor IF-3 [Spirochaetia bacterium]